MPERGFAVLEFQTTGLFPYRLDRVVEVAVVHLDARARITGRWHTVVNPLRELAGDRSHGLGAAEARAAPTFDLIAPRLVELLSGRVLVAHNAQFDTGFLMGEFARMGYRPRLGMDAICTMQLARDFLPGAGRSLSDCCAAFDIEVGDLRQALGHAVATAELLSAYVQSAPALSSWQDALDRAASMPWKHLSGPTAQWVPRRLTGAPHTPTFLERMTARLPDHSGPDGHLDYLALLDRSMLTRELSVSDLGALVQLAALRGIDRDTCRSLNVEYCDDLARVAAATGGLTAGDRADLRAVARMLDVSHVSAASAADRAEARSPSSGTTSCEGVKLTRGDIVVLTGDLARSRDDWHRELSARGFRVAPAITMRTRLLVAANPSSPTGKTGKAQDYGIPIVSEFGLRSLIGVH
ncbi:hypothetical protein GY21_10255 [Cryobacterium roopkundense]|uniref:DNA polymerase-3 subunit epsilon n=1 Tax=Cryobacterium roopkundense TaxID=1001240 RepID=A0A099J8E9_9MICO|nr:exonuclease domain-containing protein [Cryobacterium roopkundense]KGJ74654.1 hypothetical protein GY21_10255 [Cryobacterium roopkundense]MBB5640022.1 DNA polymerase-3 subunit epsilon [Cryobacterium roopkundense]